MGEAQLTDNFSCSPGTASYRGFAFVSVQATKAGEFVLTLGATPFIPPRRLPGSARLGFVWVVSDVLVIQGRKLLRAHVRGMMAGHAL